MNDRIKKFYMGIADECAKMSRAVRLQVGCVIVKNNNIMSFSWNGMPTGWSNECEEIEFIEDSEELNYPQMVAEGYTFGADKDTAGWVRRVTKPEVIHAEANAIAKLARSNESGEGAVMYITHSPCMDCSKLIYTAGIRKVFYREQYRSNDGLEFLKKCKIEVEELCDHQERK